MKNKLICVLSACFIAFSSILIPVYNVKAMESVAVVGLSAGASLLGLCVLSGVGMAFENGKKASELTDDERSRLENGLAKNYNDVALQNGIAQNKIDSWLKDVGTGIIDKSSECWGVFKDWVTNVNIEAFRDSELVESPTGQIDARNLFPYYAENGFYTQAINLSDVNTNIAFFRQNYDAVMICTRPLATENGNAWVQVNGFRKTNNVGECYRSTIWIYYNKFHVTETKSYNDTRINYPVSIPGDYIGGVYRDYTNIKFFGNNGIGLSMNNDVVYSEGLEKSNIFSTDTDYLERLKGDEVIDVIDVTDIKNPIIESRPNSLVRVDWNKNGSRKPKNDDDEKNELVWADVFYSSLDDYIEEQQNAVVVYDNYIQENPQDKDKYFISTSPITNIYQQYNTLPVVNVPAAGTIVNNNYTYNNYNNENVTIYNSETYQDDLIPYVPSVSDFFQNKFPFCIPWDVFNFVKMFYADKEAPTIIIPFPYISSEGVITSDVVISLADYEYLSTISRVMFFALFIVGLALMTRTQIKG